MESKLGPKCMKQFDLITRIADDEFRNICWNPVKAAEGDFPNIVFREKDTPSSTNCACADFETLAKGLAMANTSLVVLDGYGVLMRRDYEGLRGKVRLVTIGKEMADFVGHGMLTAVALNEQDLGVCMRELAGREPSNCPGILVFMPEGANLLEFGITAERMACEGFIVDVVMVEKMSEPLIFKIAGGMAESSLALKDIYLTLRRLKIKSVSCHLGKSMAVVEGEEFPNFRRAMSKMFGRMLKQRGYFTRGDFLMLVDVRGSPRLFLYLCVKEAVLEADRRLVDLRRVYAGNFHCDDHAPGFSVALLQGPRSLVNFADAPTACKLWPKTAYRSCPVVVPGPPAIPPSPPLPPVGPYLPNSDLMYVPIMFACKVIICSKDLLNEVDQQMQFGDKILPATDVLLKRTFSNEILFEHPYNSLNAIASICQEYIDDDIGEFLNIFFTGASQEFLNYPRCSPVEWRMWPEAVRMGKGAVDAFSSHRPGRVRFTEVPAAFVDEFESLMTGTDKPEMLAILAEAAEAAGKAVDGTQAGENSRTEPRPLEVTMQAALVILRAVVEGVRVAITYCDSE